MKKKTLALVLSAVMALGLTACGNNDATSSDAATSDKTWIIATDTSFKPFEYTDDAGNFGTLLSQHVRQVRQMV